MDDEEELELLDEVETVAALEVDKVEPLDDAALELVDADEAPEDVPLPDVLAEPLELVEDVALVEAALVDAALVDAAVEAAVDVVVEAVAVEPVDAPVVEADEEEVAPMVLVAPIVVVAALELVAAVMVLEDVVAVIVVAAAVTVLKLEDEVGGPASTGGPASPMGIMLGRTGTKRLKWVTWAEVRSEFA